MFWSTFHHFSYVFLLPEICPAKKKKCFEYNTLKDGNVMIMKIVIGKKNIETKINNKLYIILIHYTNIKTGLVLDYIILLLGMAVLEFWRQCTKTTIGLLCSIMRKFCTYRLETKPIPCRWSFSRMWPERISITSHNCILTRSSKCL